MKAMSRNDPGGIHLHAFWLARANDAAQPLWLRVAALAYGSHKANGHANFPPGWMAALFDTSPAQLSRAIRTAKDRGFIGEESASRCLVLPQGLTGGLGHPHEQCRVHTGSVARMDDF